MFHSLPLLIFLLIFLSAAVWIAGNYLSSTTDVLSVRLGLGEAQRDFFCSRLHPTCPKPQFQRVQHLRTIWVSPSATFSVELRYKPLSWCFWISSDCGGEMR